MSTQDTLTDETLAGADGNVPASDGGAAVSSNALTLDELNSFLGKDFKDKDTALKALKDTQSFVGKRVEDIAAEVRKELAPAPQSEAPNLESEIKSLKDDLFYTQNPQFKDYRTLIEKFGGSPAEVVELAEFKTLFEKVSAADEAAQNKSVVHSSPRLAQTKTVTDEAVQMANSRSATLEDVASVFARELLSEEQA